MRRFCFFAKVFQCFPLQLCLRSSMHQKCWADHGATTVCKKGLIWLTTRTSKTLGSDRRPGPQLNMQKKNWGLEWPGLSFVRRSLQLYSIYATMKYHAISISCNTMQYHTQYRAIYIHLKKCTSLVPIPTQLRKKDRKMQWLWNLWKKIQCITPRIGNGNWEVRAPS